MQLNELTPQEQEAYRDVAEELRCLVCQNQSIADSQAGLATDLKVKIVEQLREGKTKQEIKTYMQERYGDFILYKPEVDAANAGLWFGPFVVLLLAVFLAARLIKKHKSINPKSASTQNTDSLDWAEKLYKEEHVNSKK